MPIRLRILNTPPLTGPENVCDQGLEPLRCFTAGAYPNGANSRECSRKSASCGSLSNRRYDAIETSALRALLASKPSFQSDRRDLLIPPQTAFNLVPFESVVLKYNTRSQTAGNIVRTYVCLFCSGVGNTTDQKHKEQYQPTSNPNGNICVTCGYPSTAISYCPICKIIGKPDHCERQHDSGKSSDGNS